jgi:hypothetical protein
VPPAVSILMPTFNRLEFLPAAIESVFGQSFRVALPAPPPSGCVRERVLTDAVMAMPTVIVARDLLELRLAAASELDGVNEPAFTPRLVRRAVRPLRP